MAERLEWIKAEPTAWAHWDAVRGGLEGHALVAARYPAAACHVMEDSPQREAAARHALTKPWWHPGRWHAAPLHFGALGDGSVGMLWANMGLHMAADPQSLIQRWHQTLAVDGFLMFSCLGPDTLRELRGMYQALGWPVPAHVYTDMHDWGDMLVHAGFAEPVMDMERITLTYQAPTRLLADLRELGRNLHPARFAGLRTPRWRSGLEAAISQHLRTEESANGTIALSFEVIYGHAFKPAPRVKLDERSAVSLNDMRAMLRAGRNPS